MNGYARDSEQNFDSTLWKSKDPTKLPGLRKTLKTRDTSKLEAVDAKVWNNRGRSSRSLSVHQAELLGPARSTASHTLAR